MKTAILIIQKTKGNEQASLDFFQGKITEYFGTRSIEKMEIDTPIILLKGEITEEEKEIVEKFCDDTQTVFFVEVSDTEEECCNTLVYKK